MAESSDADACVSDVYIKIEQDMDVDVTEELLIESIMREAGEERAGGVMRGVSDEGADVIMGEPDAEDNSVNENGGTSAESSDHSYVSMEPTALCPMTSAKRNAGNELPPPKKVAAQRKSSIIASLLEKPWNERPMDERDVIIKQQPTPDLPLLTCKSAGAKSYNRHFNPAIYTKYKWIAGCDEKHALFCWPCLLFTTDRTAWTTGYSNLNNLTNSILCHDTSISHKSSQIRMTKYLNRRMEMGLPSNLRDQVQNQQAKLNINLLKRLVRAVCFLAQQQIPFCGDPVDDEKKGILMELMEYTSQYDTTLMPHLLKSNVFRELSNQVQIDLINSIASVTLEAIKEEIAASPFVSIIVGEAIGPSNEHMLSLMVRYCYHGQVKERFIKLVELSGRQSPEAIADTIVQELEEFVDKGKLVSQSYDGAAVEASLVNQVQATVKDRFASDGLLVHYHGHGHDQVLAQSASLIKHCRIFFATLNGIADFFTQSPERCEFLKTFVENRLPSVSSNWDFSSNLVESVYKQKNELREILETMLEFSLEVEFETLAVVQRHLLTLNDFMFNFLLAVFNAIFAHPMHVDATQRLTEKKPRKKTENLKQTVMEAIKSLQTSEKFNELYSEALNDVGPPVKSRLDPTLDPKTSCWEIFNQIIDTLTEQINIRSQDSTKFNFLLLLNHSQFKRFANKEDFPTLALKELIKTYGKLFNEVALRLELLVVYRDVDFHGRTPAALCTYLWVTGHRQSLPLVAKLAALMATYPFTAPYGPSPPCLKKVIGYACDTAGPKAMSGLALMSMEATFLRTLLDKGTFFHDVLQLFSQGERKKEFEFK